MTVSNELYQAKDDQERFKAIVERRRKARMDAIDRLPQDIRALVHEYGYTVVNALLEVGVTKSRQIRHIVETVLNEFSPTRGSYSRQGKRTDAEPKSMSMEEGSK